MTEVLHLPTGRRFYYTLPPEEAVRCAYIQYKCGDKNTWQYAQWKEKVQYGRYTVTCGEFTALRKAT